jgi:hypothetical protein
MVVLILICAATFEVASVKPTPAETRIRAAGSASLPMNTEQRQMLQALLVDRFQLKYDREEREGDQ